jgi:hypothetical protein
MVPERKEDGKDGTQREQCDEDSEEGPLVPSLDEPAWLHERHCFPSVRLLFECTDVVAVSGESRLL